ncbi:hypothetical protein [Vibrio cyclitrophicus]|uniref:hypothetical protein n=1 Tax=Vibrio cyclitrophicus TaxID=47951 RepID=UPI0007EED470|nr:hypothetical protein [Vibrio cyclitrophicus]OBT07562.1 hypothetical protein A9265_14220 [Vibrio cyclitrophicus]
MHNFEFLELQNLNLDPKNPRLPSRLRGKGSVEIANWMLKDNSLIELMLAIGTNGYFVGEPMLVVEEEGKVLVVEGNRRLTSLMLLNEMIEPSIMVGSIEQVLNLTTQRPEQIPCIKFDNRAEVEKYLGFRHVTGVKEWSPLAKARYLTSIMASTIDNGFSNFELRELAKQIGSKRPYVQRLLVSYRIYELIEENDFFNIPNLDEETFHFTYLMDSLNRPGIREYLGIDFDIENSLENIIIDNIKQLMEWFFLRLKSGRTVMNASSGNLAMFCSILDNKSSFEYFEETANLKKAYETTINKTEDYRELIVNIKNDLKTALSKRIGLDEVLVSDISDAEEISALTNYLLSELKKDIEGRRGV